MELELGLKITRTRDDVSSSVDFRFSKDSFGPLVLSRETDSRFIIIIHLKGFKKEGIEIAINKEGNRITIRGRKPVEELVLIRWMAWRKEVELRTFKKVFLIPDVVDLDKIKARFDDDDSTLTITMPKRVKGISGLKIEEEEAEKEEEEEEDDVSEAVTREKIQNREEVDEDDVERVKSDGRSENEIQREEEFGEIIGDKERESQGFEGEKEGFSKGLNEEETEDDNLQKIHQIGQQNKILEFEEDEEIGQPELTDSNTGSEDSSLRELPDIQEERDSHEQTRHEEQELVVEQRDSQPETKSDDIGSREFGEIEEQEPDEQLVTTSTSGAREKKTTNDDGDDSSSEVQAIKEPERHNEERKIQEIVKGETGGHQKKKIVNMERKKRDAKEEVDVKTGERITTNTKKTKIDGEEDIAENETKSELESDELEANEIDEIHDLVEKKEEENAKVGRQSEDRSLIKLQENADQNSKGQKRQDKQEKTKELVEKKTPEAETNVADDTSGITGDEEKHERKEKKIVKMDIKNGDDKIEIHAKLGDGSALKFSETETKPDECESETLKADEEEKMQKLIEKKKENAKIGTPSEDINLITEEQQFLGKKQHDKQEKLKEMVEEQTPEAETNVADDTPKPVQERGEGKQKIQKLFQEETKTQPEEYKEKITETGEKISDPGARKVQELIRQQELVEPERCKKESKTQELVQSTTNDKEKEIAESETKERRSDRPKILGEQEKIQELADEKTNFSENERDNEKKTEVDGGKVGDIKQRDSETMKGEEEKDESELEQREKVSDGGKGIIVVSETIAENYKSRKVQEIDEQSHEEETCGNQKIRGEASGRQEVEDVENEKKTIEAEKRIKDSTRDCDVSGKYFKGTTTQELEESTGVHQNKHEEENKSEADRPEKITSRVEQKLVNLNSQLAQENIEAEGERTQELVEEEPKDCKEEEAGKVKGNEESKTKTNDGVVRKFQGTKEQELYEPKREHVSKIKELKEEKEMAESEKEAEYSSFRNLDGSEGHELHEPKIHKERDKTLITGTWESSSQDIEYENSTHIQETKEKQSDKPESHEKRSKIQELVEAGYDDRKEEQREEKAVAKEEQETEEDSSKKVQEIENQEYDELKRSMVQDKRQDTEEKDKTRAMEGKEMVERRTMTKDGSLRDDDFRELSKPHKRQEEDKIQELVEMGRSDYREKVKKLQDGSDILRNPERPNLDEFNGHSEERNIPQLVEDENSGKSYEDWIHEEREERQELVKEEETDKSGGVSHNDHKEEQQEGNVMAKAELKTEEDNLKKVQETEKQECDDLKRSVVHEKTQETEEKDKIRAMEAKDIVERRKKTKDSCLGKVRDDDFPESSKSYKRQEEGKVQELVESDYREKVKKQYGDDILRSQEAERPDLDDFKRESEERKNSQFVEDDSSGKLHEFKELKSDEEWTHEEREKIRDIKEEATDPKDKCTCGKGHNDHKEKQQEENVIAKAELKIEEDISKNVEETEQQGYDELKGSVVQEKMQETEDKGKTRAMEKNEIVERRERTKDGSLRKVKEGEDPEMDKHKKHGEVDRIQKLVETVISDHREKIKKKDEDDNLRRQEIHQSVEDEKGEGKLERNSERGGKMEGDSLGKLHDFHKQSSYENWRQEESEEVKNLVGGEATYPKDKYTGEREHEEATKIQEAENNELHESERHEKLDIVEDVVEDKTEDQKDEKEEEAASVVAENEKGSSRKVQTIREQESGKHKKQIKIPKMSDPEVKEDEERVSEKERKEKETNVIGEATYPKDKHSGGVEHDEERYEKVARNETKVEDEINKKVGENKELESIKQERYNKLDKLEGVIREAARDREKEENLVDDFPTKIQETEKEELYEPERDEKLDIVEDVEGDETEDQKDEEAEEAAAVVAENEKGSLRKVQTIEEQDSGKHKEQSKLPRKNDPEVKEEDEERVSEEETKEKEAHVQELEAKTENWKDDDSAGKRREHEKTVKSENEDQIPRKIRETKVQESNENKNQEWEDKTEEQERKETSNHKTKLVTEDDSLRKGSNVPKRRPVEPKKFQELKEAEKREDEELEWDESEEKNNLKKIREPMEEEKWGPEKENEKIAEEMMQDEINSRIKEQEIKGQEPYELLRNGEHNKIPEISVKGTKDHNREEEKEMEERVIEATKRKSEDVSSRKVQQIKAEESEKHRKLSEVHDNENIGDFVEENIKEHKDGEMKEDVEETGSYQPKQEAEQVKVQELKTEKDGKEDCDMRGEKMKKQKRETEILRGQKKKEKLQEVVETGTSDQRKEGNEEELVRKAETIDEDENSRIIHEHEKGYSDNVEQQEEEEMSGKIAEEETKVDKEGNRLGDVLGEGETKITNGSFGKVREIIKQEQDQKKSPVEEEISSKEKEKKNQETKSSDDSSRKTQANEKQESHERNRNEEQDKNLELVGENTNYSTNEEDGKEDEEISDEKMVEGHENQEKEQGTKNLEMVGKKTNYCTKEEDGKEDEEIAEEERVERDENRDNIKELVEEKMENQEKEDKKSMITKELAKEEDHETKGREGLRKQDQSKELEQRIRDNFQGEETANTETKSKDNESRKIHQTKEEERLKEQGRVKELVEDRTHSYRETEPGSSKKIQEIDKKESIEPGGDEKRDKIQEPVDRETSEDDEEELEIEFEEEEEEWEAEVIQEMDSDEDKNKLREIRRIKLGFRLVGGSALFMSLIVIVIRFIHSKRKIRSYKF